MKSIVGGVICLLTLTSCSGTLLREAETGSGTTTQHSSPPSDSRKLARPPGVDPARCTSYVLATIHSGQVVVKGDVGIIHLRFFNSFKGIDISVSPGNKLATFGTNNKRQKINLDPANPEHITLSSNVPFKVAVVCATRNGTLNQPSPKPSNLSV